MVADIAQEDRTVGDIGKLTGRKRVLRSPPSIEMTAVVATEPRAAPAAIQAGSRFVVQAAAGDRQTLHQKSGPPPNRIPAMLSELFQKLLVALRHYVSSHNLRDIMAHFCDSLLPLHEGKVFPFNGYRFAIQASSRRGLWPNRGLRI